MRWIWIDRFVEFRRGEFARALKQWSMSEDLFAEHFPEYPIVPGSLLIRRAGAFDRWYSGRRGHT